jgi:uncharacterized RDD family membrane protein YckC
MDGICRSCGVSAGSPACHNCGGEVVHASLSGGTASGPHPGSAGAPGASPAYPAPGGGYPQPGYPQPGYAQPGDPGYAAYGGADPAQGRAHSPASVGARIGGYLLDLLFCYGITFIGGGIVGVALAVAGVAVPEESTGLWGLSIFCAVALVYYVVPTALWGRTLAKAMLGTRVVGMDGADRLGFGVALGRQLLLGLMGLFFFGIPALVCAITMGNEPLKRGWHDRASGTMVIRTR